jgi:hypothetical protein
MLSRPWKTLQAWKARLLEEVSGGRMTFSPPPMRNTQAQPSRQVQAGWLLFALFSLSLGAAGVSAYHQLLRVPCQGADCLPGQFTPEEMAQAVPAYFQTVAERADLDGLMAIVIATLLTGSAAFFIWKRSWQRAFVLTATRWLRCISVRAAKSRQACRWQRKLWWPLRGFP